MEAGMKAMPMTLDFTEATEEIGRAGEFLFEHSAHLPAEVLNCFAVVAESLFSADTLDLETAERAGEFSLRLKLPHGFHDTLAALRASDRCPGVPVHAKPFPPN